MKFTARLPETNVNVTPTSPLREFFVLAGGLAGLAVVLYLALGLAVDLIVPRLSPALETRLGALFLNAAPESGPRSETTAYLETLLDRLQKTCARLPYTFTIRVVDHPAVNAMALPGGHIVVFTGLVEKVTSENELAFVLAHELGHYAHRDHLRGVGRALVLMVASALVFGPDSSAGSMLAKTLNITDLSFSRKQETRADEFALDTLHCTYGHVGGAWDFFRKMSTEQDPGVFGHYFSTHPENRRRMGHIRQRAREKGYTESATLPVGASLRPAASVMGNPSDGGAHAD